MMEPTRGIRHRVGSRRSRPEDSFIHILKVRELPFISGSRVVGQIGSYERRCLTALAALPWRPTAGKRREYSGAAQNDDLNVGLESDTFVASLSNVPLSASLQQAVPDVSGFARVANHPRALQRHGRRDQYIETWGLTIEHELPARVLLAGSYLGTHEVRLFSRER